MGGGNLLVNTIFNVHMLILEYAGIYAWIKWKYKCGISLNLA